MSDLVCLLFIGKVVEIVAEPSKGWVDSMSTCMCVALVTYIFCWCKMLIQICIHYI